MKVAILKAGYAPRSLAHIYGDYDALCTCLLGYEPRDVSTYAVHLDQFPKSPDAYDLYVITGSHKGVHDSDSWIARLIDFAGEAYLAKARLIGFGFGHQVLAEALGGEVQRADCGASVGIMNYTAFPSGRTVALCTWNKDQVITSPVTAKRILTSGSCPNAGLRYGNRAISFQPHAEFPKALFRELIVTRRGKNLPHNIEAKARQTFSRETSTPIIQFMLQNFLESVPEMQLVSDPEQISVRAA